MGSASATARSARERATATARKRASAEPAAHLRLVAGLVVKGLGGEDERLHGDENLQQRRAAAFGPALRAVACPGVEQGEADLRGRDGRREDGRREGGNRGDGKQGLESVSGESVSQWVVQSSSECARECVRT